MNRPVFIILMLVPLVGCVPEHTKPLEREPATAAERNFEALWRASKDVLKKYDFPIDRQDRRAGVITTYAVPSGHLFELWRRDAATAFHYQENTVQNILRAARVTIRRQGPESNQYDFQVEVVMARSNLPPTQLTDTSQLLGMQFRGLPELRFHDLQRRSNRDTAQPMLPPRKRDERNRLVPLGRDSDMEMYLARDIRELSQTFETYRDSWITMP
jgi:hypothetical protein